MVTKNSEFHLVFGISLLNMFTGVNVTGFSESRLRVYEIRFIVDTLLNIRKLLTHSLQIHH